ncbi:uncharacterized protein LOC110830503 [Zootermopsis nevadensis]|uniref:uncharacterized protein LOC110830503 n=1 Tax=Zootermopsis nevadensis TaxID=136037 RepID=UPI000B8ECF48|nr:uncharacterized protein LOC110830503 [Zootermopsis nevadensis]
MYQTQMLDHIKKEHIEIAPPEEDSCQMFYLPHHASNLGPGREYITTSDLITYRFTRLPFGLTCSPFLLSATLRELATMYKHIFPQATSLVDKNMYMDDFAAGAEDDDGVINLYNEVTSLMGRIRLPMAKWATNSQPLMELWKTEGLVINMETQVLGTHWNTRTDTFTVDRKNVTNNLRDGPVTKRQLLQTAARFYDSLGLLSPVSLIAKALFQDTWTRGIGWDELLPPDLGTRWHRWVSTLPSPSDILIPRWVGTSDKDSYEIHVFCDASEGAYGAVLYVRTSTCNHYSVRLLCSKNRLAPVKRVTLPRLELLGALLGSRLLRYLCEATNFDVRNALLWTDSTVTLGWIRHDPNRWKPFVSNRVTEIHNHTNTSQWRHCPGKENPADLLSRGVTADKLKNSDIWWHGPSWLSKPVHHWPLDAPTTDTPLPELRSYQTHASTGCKLFKENISPWN